MKRRIWIYLAIIGIGFLLWLFWRAFSSKGLIPEQNKTHAAKNNSISLTNAVGTVSRIPTKVSQYIKSVSDLQKREDLYHQALEAENVPLNFYGRFVDQDDKPLAGVGLKFAVRHWDATAPSQGYSIFVKRTTDGNGNFDIHEVMGDGFDLNESYLPGYDLEPNILRTYGAIGGSPTNPIAFKMWRKDIKEPLISNRKTFHLLTDGKTYAIDLPEGTTSQSSRSDLNIWIKYVETLGQTNDWQSQIEVSNGGLLQETNTHSSMFLAPTNGYLNVFQFDQHIRGGQHGSTGPLRFYLKLKNGQEYGRMNIELLAPFNKQVPGLIRIDYAINPAGSRILR